RRGADRTLLGGLRLGGGFGARLALGFLLGQLPLLARLALFEALPSPVGLLLFFPLPTDLGLGMAVVLHQRNAAGTDIRAGATLDAVHQVKLLGLFQLAGTGKPVKLLWQQLGRAGFGTQATADTGQGGRRGR